MQYNEPRLQWLEFQARCQQSSRQSFHMKSGYTFTDSAFFLAGPAELLAGHCAFIHAAVARRQGSDAEVMFRLAVVQYHH